MKIIVAALHSFVCVCLGVCVSEQILAAAGTKTSKRLKESDEGDGEREED